MNRLVVLALVTAACSSPAATAPEISETTIAVAPATSTSTPPTTTATTTTTLAQGPRYPARISTGGLFTFDDPSEVIPNGPPEAWDWQYTDPGAVLVDEEGVIHVLQNGFVNWPAPVGVGYWRSEDGGDSWSEISDDAVFDGTALPYVGRAALASSVIVEPDGTWVLYFYTWDAAGWPAAPSKIGRATAPGPEGPWAPDAEPVLMVGPDGAWDGFNVRTPSVIRDGGGYTMFYAGGVRDQAMIGMATSADGINWTKYDDPTTTDPPFAESDPVLMPGDPREGNVWDQRNVYQPRVVSVGGTFVMVYSSSTTVTDSLRLVRKTGIAISDDGLNWTRSLANVVTTGQLNAGAFWFSALGVRDDELLLFMEAQIGNETSVHLARASLADLMGRAKQAR